MSLNQLQTLVSEGHPYWYSYAVSRGLFSESLSPVSGNYYASIESAWNSLWNEMQKINKDFRSKTTTLYDGRIIYDLSCNEIINKTTELEITNFEDWEEFEIRSPDRMKKKLRLTYGFFRPADKELFNKFHKRINKLYDIYNKKYNYTSTNKISSELEKKLSAYEEKKRKKQAEQKKQYFEQRKERQKRLQLNKERERRENDLFDRVREGEFNDDDDDEVKALENELDLIEKNREEGRKLRKQHFEERQKAKERERQRAQEKDNDIEALENELDLIEETQEILKKQLDKIKRTNYEEEAAKAARRAARKQRKEEDEEKRRESIVNKVSKAIETIKEGDTRRTCFDGTDDDAKLGDGTTNETCFKQYQLIYDLIKVEKDKKVKRRIKELLKEFQTLYTKNQKKKKGDSQKFHRTGLRHQYNGLTHEKLMNTLLNQL